MVVKSRGVIIQAVQGRPVRAEGDSGGGSGATLLVYDSFTEASDTSLLVHEPDTDETGGGWSVSGGTWTVDSGSDTLSPPLTADRCAYFDLSAQSSVFIQMSPASTNATSALLRFVDENNFWIVIAANTGASTMQIYEKTSGSFILRAEGTASSFSTMWAADDGGALYGGKDGAAADVSFASSVHSSSKSCGTRASGTDSNIDDFYAYGGTVDPADIP